MSARSARRPIPAMVFLVALAVLATVVWVRVAGRDSAASAKPTPTCPATAAALPANGAVTVTVLNSTDRSGLAKSTLDAFVSLGFVAGTYDNVTGVTGVAVVTSGPNGTADAKLVAYYVPGATVTTDDRADTSVTVALGPQFSALATAAVAGAAIAKDGLKQATPSSAAPAASSPPAGATPSPGASSSAKVSASPSC